MLAVVPLRAQPAVTRRILDLDRQDSYAELPGNLFTNEVVTLECWVKWREFEYHSHGVDFWDASLHFSVQNLGTSPSLEFHQWRPPGFDDLHHVPVANLLRTNQWLHLAVVTGTNFAMLYLNGRLLTTNQYSSAWTPASPASANNFLGRSVMKAVVNASPDREFNGQMPEVRLWAGERNADQIAANFMKRLTGREPGLLALWNFADGTANDASPARRHGRLLGPARVVEAVPPFPASTAPWSRIVGKVTGIRGQALANITVRATVDGREIASTTSGGNGEYALTLWTRAPAVDLSADGPNEAGGWRLGTPVPHYGQFINDWVLNPAVGIAGTANALDGRTPHSRLVVELIQPEGGSVALERSRTRPETRSDESDDSNPDPEKSSSLNTSAPTTDRVLQLPNDASFVQLPLNIFDDFIEATVEGWVRCQPLQEWGVIFDYGKVEYSELRIGVHNRLALIAAIGISREDDHKLELYGIRTNEWFHFAYSTGPRGGQLYLNGVLVRTNSFTGSFAAIPRGDINYLGRDLGRKVRHEFDDLVGQIGEFPVWRVQRTAGQIRENLRARLTGSEPGLADL
ncbi:MAG: hypothetical protein EXS36_03425 [Pedosphaera sp.]|nr:hypothetical protein [Pedosphaera sp.]